MSIILKKQSYVDFTFIPLIKCWYESRLKVVIWILKQVKVSVGDELGVTLNGPGHKGKTSEHQKPVAMVTNSCIQPCIRKYLEY